MRKELEKIIRSGLNELKTTRSGADLLQLARSLREDICSRDTFPDYYETTMRREFAHICSNIIHKYEFEEFDEEEGTELKTRLLEALHNLRSSTQVRPDRYS